MGQGGGGLAPGHLPTFLRNRGAELCNVGSEVGRGGRTIRSGLGKFLKPEHSMEILLRK